VETLLARLVIEQVRTRRHHPIDFCIVHAHWCVGKRDDIYIVRRSILACLDVFDEAPVKPLEAPGETKSVQLRPVPQ
jgi:hypothetical protein